jgi:hypothetical protein
MYEPHPLIETPPDDTIIWRYMDLTKLLAMCARSALHLCRMDHLRDPWEGKWPQGILDGYRAAMKSAVPTIREEVSQLIGSDAWQITFFVNCWHESPVESAALWAQYGLSGGLAIRSTIGHVKRACQSSEPFVMGRVRYIDYDQPDSTVMFGNLLTPAFLKRASFNHEQEVRLLRFKLPSTDSGFILNASLAQGFEELPIALPDLVESVHISPECPEWHVKPIQQALQKFGLQVPVRRSTLYERRVR